MQLARMVRYPRAQRLFAGVPQAFGRLVLDIRTGTWYLVFGNSDDTPRRIKSLSLSLRSHL